MEPKQTPPTTPPPLTRNLISFIGWVLTLIFGVIIVVLVSMDVVLLINGSEHGNPYNSIVTYLVLPGFLVAGIALILLGAALEWRRRHKKDPGEYPRLPYINLNEPWQRRRILLATGMLAFFFSASALGVYHSYHFTETPLFCGMVCHTVMEPEYTAYQHSPHARVACTECHIGPGAEWYVRAKFSGLRQVYAVLADDYELPIDTPVHNLRPARGTCEQCHWPSKFMNSVEKVVWHFSPDQSNTPGRTNLLLKIGGGNPELGLGAGIHWHVNPSVTVRYWARDEDRLDIPWVEVQQGDETPRVFRTPDCPDELPVDAEIRTMDCIDCHNRPAHQYRSPNQVIDFHMASGYLNRSMPFFKRYASELLEQQYGSRDEAMEAIDSQLREKYADWVTGEEGRIMLEGNIEALQTLYNQNFFPRQGVDWRIYPTHNGHMEWPGCMRCHTEQHQDDRGVPIPGDCRICHEILDQAEGEAAFDKPNLTGGEYAHPRGMNDVYKGRQCYDCHGVLQAWPDALKPKHSQEIAIEPSENAAEHKL